MRRAGWTPRDRTAAARQALWDTHNSGAGLDRYGSEMTQPHEPAARWASRLLLLVFWLAVLIAGSRNPGYTQVQDHVSNLASFGADPAWVGILAIAAFGAADVVGAVVAAATSRFSAAALVVAGVAGLTIAAARIHCLGGAAGCLQSGPGDSSWTDTVHSGAVAVNALAFAVAMVALAGARWRARDRARAALMVVMVVGSIGCLLASLDGQAVGAWQRGWLLINTGLLVWVTAPRRTPA